MKKDYIPFVLTILIAIFFIIIAQQFNLGVSPDSISYLEVARNFSEAKGIVNNNNQFVNHWPPGYPILLGTSAWLTGIDVFDIGLYVNSILVVIFGFSFIFIFKELKLDNLIIRVLPLLLLCSRSSIVFFMFWSEGLFLALMSITILFFIKWMKKESYKYILLAGVFSGLFFITRYAGLGIIAGFVLFIFLSKKTILFKLKNSTLYLLPIGLFYFIWFYYSSLFDLPSMDRKVILHIIQLDIIKDGVITIAKWFAGHKFIETSLLLLIVAILLLLSKVKKYFLNFTTYIKSWNKIVFFTLLLIVTYTGAIVFSISLFDAHTPLNNRILSPLFPFVVILLGIFLNFFIVEKQLLKNFYLLTFILLLSVSLSSFFLWKRQYIYGSGYTGVAYKNSQVLKYIKTSSSNKIDIFTNGHDVIWFYTALKTYKIPIEVYAQTNQPNLSYNDNLLKMKAAIQKGKAQLIYLDEITWRWYFMSREDILAEFEVFDIQYFDDGFLIKNKD